MINFELTKYKPTLLKIIMNAQHNENHRIIINNPKLKGRLLKMKYPEGKYFRDYFNQYKMQKKEFKMHFQNSCTQTNVLKPDKICINM